MGSEIQISGFFLAEWVTRESKSKLVLTGDKNLTEESIQKKKKRQINEIIKNREYIHELKQFNLCRTVVSNILLLFLFENVNMSTSLNVYGTLMGSGCFVFIIETRKIWVNACDKITNLKTLLLI